MDASTTPTTTHVSWKTAAASVLPTSGAGGPGGNRSSPSIGKFGAIEEFGGGLWEVTTAVMGPSVGDRPRPGEGQLVIPARAIGPETFRHRGPGTMRWRPAVRLARSRTAGSDPGLSDIPLLRDSEETRWVSFEETRTTISGA
ncbi:MAG: hypothetical protein NVS3B21_07250 [Acidimicrobiales bacterium]